METTAPVAMPSRRAAHFGLGVLTLINLLNYLDRYIVAGVLPRIEKDLGLQHDAAGLLGTVFIVVYMLSSPVGGYLGDRIPRRFLVAGGVFLWSIATIGSGLATSFLTLMIARGVVGIGEAGYGTVAPAIISDLYPREQRTRMLAYFYTAIPVGAAAGYALGGYLGQAYSWHIAFFVGGVPGLVLATAMLFAPEPKRGAADVEAGPEKIPLLVGLKNLRHNAMFWFNSVGLTLMTFSIGGLAFWMPTFLETERHMSGARAGQYFGAITAVAGLVGTLVGGWLGDWADRKRTGGGMYVSGVGLAVAAPLMYIAANLTGEAAIFGVIFVAQFMLFLNNGPINAALVNAVPSAFRAFAFSLNVLMIHLLGDALSPPVIGLIGKHWSLGTAIELNAVPVLVGGIVLLVGAGRMAGRGGTAPQTAPAA